MCKKNLDEAWKDVPGYEGYYQASTLGRIKSVDRIDCAGRKRKSHILKPGTHRKGYTCVVLCRNGKMRTFKVHILVLGAFSGDRPHNHECNHIDGDKSNNAIGNLAWVTAKENMEHAVANGLRARGETIATSKLTSNDVVAIREMAGSFTNECLSKRYGVVPSVISLVINRKIWKWVP